MTSTPSAASSARIRSALAQSR
ncbi:MAG: hypothetical protein QOD49_971, partial [Actinomycetota bacterium]|nr:hypothetical protein [Actinomycetota bacterium]